MNKRTVILRADGGPNIGMGHFMRTLALGEMLKDDFDCVYATRCPSKQQIENIKSVCYDLIELPNDETHFQVFIDLLDGNEIVVLDNYFFDTSYQQIIKDKGCFLVCIDDMHDKHYVADVIINHAGGIPDEMFSVESYTRIFTGYDYTILRKPFLETIKMNPKKEIDILIAIGGTDPLGLTDVIVDEVTKVKQQMKIVIIAGSGYKLTAKYADKDIEVFHNISSKEVAYLMEKSRFGIFPASTIAMEAIAMRLPFAVGYFVENQRNIYNDLLKNKLAINIGYLPKLKNNTIYDIVHTLTKNQLEEIIANQQKALDKKSPERLLTIFKSLM